MRLLIIGMSFLLLLVVASWVIRQQNAQSATVMVSPTPTDIHSGDPSVFNAITPTESITQANIIVTAPQPDVTVSSPVEISGEARVFENSLNYRLKTVSGVILAEGYMTADSPDIGQFGPFTAIVQFVTPKLEREGIVEVFSLSARDGSEINMTSIPVRFALTNR